MRFKNESAAAVSAATKGIDGQEIIISLSTYSQRTKPSKTVRLTFTERVAKGLPGADQVFEIKFDRELNRISPFSEKSRGDLWTKLPEDTKKEIMKNVQSRFLGPRDNLRFKANGRSYTVNFNKEDIRFPFRPVKGHLMGIDGAGRDVFARILYGLRTFMSFGLLLVFASMVVGIITGALAALDYLGFGLPPPTPSWGELLFQAQQFRWAWWLIL